MSSLAQRRSGARNGAQVAERAISEELARQEAARAEKQAAIFARRKTERDAEKARTKLTAEDVGGARVVRDSFGWHVVVRTSAKSVTVETPYSWTERIPLDKILEAKR